MRSFTTMGLDVPAPGSFVRQTRFSSNDHFVGRPFSWLTAEPSGPRNRSQSAPKNNVKTATQNKLAKQRDLGGMGNLPL